jgi:hypothetical protein
MLIETITFEIQNFKNNTSESFMVADTIENQEMVLSHRFTRLIKFAKVFDFQFEKEMNIPIEMITADTWLRLLNTQPELFAAVAESV